MGMKAVSKRSFAKKPRVTVSIRLPEDLKEELERLAQAAGHSFSDFVQEGLDQWSVINGDQGKPRKP